MSLCIAVHLSLQDTDTYSYSPLTDCSFLSLGAMLCSPKLPTALLVLCRYLKMLTFLPLEQIQRVEGDMQQSSYKPNTAQRLLAEEVIRFVHGGEGLSAALSATKVACCMISLLFFSAPLAWD